MAERGPTTSGLAGGASGMHTISLFRPGPGPGRPVAEHWAYDTRAEALDDLGWIVERVPSGTELVLRDPEGVDQLRVTKTA